MRISDRVSGIGLIVLGGLAAWGGSRLPPVPGQQIGPNVFPMVVGIGLMLCGLLITLHIGRSFEDEAEADFAAHGGEAASEQASDSPWFGLRALIPPVLVLFYVLASERIGFIATGGIMVFVCAMVLGAKVKHALPVAVVVPFCVHLIFFKLLRVPLPTGFIPTPW
jgi:putative tricarboxylic transport membrane protein